MSDKRVKIQALLQKKSLENTNIENKTENLLETLLSTDPIHSMQNDIHSQGETDSDTHNVITSDDNVNNNLVQETSDVNVIKQRIQQTSDVNINSTSHTDASKEPSIPVSIADHISKMVEEQTAKKKTVEETHTRLTFIVHNDIVERWEKYFRRKPRGFKTRVINQLLKAFLDSVDQGK